MRQVLPNLWRGVRSILLVGPMLLQVRLAAQAPPPRLVAFLERDIGLKTEEVGAIGGPAPVTKVLPATGRDIALFGIVAVNVPRAFLVARLQDFPQSLKTPTRPRFGLFSTPPVLADVRAEQITADELQDLRSCRPESCNFKLPASDMTRLREEVGGPDSAAVRQATSYVQQRMIDFVTDYRGRGNAAMLVYDDHGGIEASQAFRDLLAASPYVYNYAPAFHQYLLGYPQAKLTGVTDAVFWSRDEMPSLRPILSINHVSVYAPPDLPGATLVSNKQIYANHYFEGALDLLTICDRSESGDPSGVYVVLLRRYRFDNLKTGAVSLRGKVTGKLQDYLAGELAHLKRANEEAFAAAPGR